MRRACTLLACGWSFQSQGAEGFTGMAGGRSGWASLAGTVRQRSDASRASCAAATAGWQRRPPRRVFGDCCDVSGVCRRAKTASTLDRQEDGAPVGEGTSNDVVGVDSVSSSSSGGDVKPNKKGRNGGKQQRKPMNSNANGRNKLFDLLNGLEGGGGGGIEALELLGISEEDDDMVDDEGALDGQEDVQLMIDGQGEGARSPDADETSGEGEGENGEQEQPNVRRRLRVRAPVLVPPLTRSQAEEDRVLPVAKRIQELSRDKKNESNWVEVMGLMADVKEEHGERGLGLTHVYKVGMKSCLDFGHAEEALRLFSELKAFKESPPNRQCFDMAIVANCLLGQRDEAMDTILEMKEAGYEPTERTYINVLRACRKTEGGAAVANRAIELYASEEGLDVDGLLPRNIALCHAHLVVLALANEWEQAVEILWSMVERGRPAPDTACYDAVLLACQRGGRWREALAVLDHLRREDVAVKPSDGMYTLAMMTMLRDEEEESDAAVSAALGAWEEYRQLGMFDALRPSRKAFILHAVFSACVRWEQHWPKAMEAFYMMKDQDDLAPTAREYRSMLHMLSLSKDVERGGNWMKSVDLLKEAQDLELRLTEVSFRTVIADLGFAKQVDMAFDVFDDMRMAGIPPSLATYNRLLGVCEKNGDVERTFKVLDEMYEAGISPTVVSFCSAISACGKGLQWRRSLALLVRMQHDEIMPNLQCLNAAIHALGLSGEWRRAEAILEVIWKSGMTPDVVSYNSIAMAYTTAGESDRALEVLETMRANGVDPDEVTFGTLLMACDGEHAFSTMRSLMDDMDDMGIKKTVIHFSAAIDAANRMEETGMAWELWRLMGVNGVEPNNYAYSSIIITAAIDRDVRTALRLLEEMKKKEMDIDVVTYTSAICACGPDWLLALDVLEDMALDGVPPNLLSFTAAMGACLKGEEHKEAIVVYNRMKEAGIAPDLRAYNLAITAHENDGNFYGRISVEAEMQSANLLVQDRDWETGWQPPPDGAQGGYDDW